jgi:hypothetical protein
MRILSKRSEKFQDFVRAFPDNEVDDGSCILVDSGDETFIAEPRLNVLAMFKYWAKSANNGQIVAVSTEPPVSKEELCQTPMVDAVCLLHIGSTCVPVNVSFRSKTKTQFADSVDGMLKKVTRDEWFGKSEHHAGTKAIPNPYARFTSVIRFKRGKTANGPYCAFEPVHQVITKEQLQAVYTCFQENGSRIQAMITKFKEHVAKVQADSGKPPVDAK